MRAKPPSIVYAVLYSVAIITALFAAWCVGAMVLSESRLFLR